MQITKVSMDIKGVEIKIKNKIWTWTKDYFYPQRVKDSPLVRNINYDGLGNQKRALICYTPNIFFQSIDIKTIGRTLPIEIFKLIKILSEYGFCIDIISVNDIRALEFVKSTNYFLIFGFGETFYEITRFQPDALSVFYVTENHPEFSMREEQKRLDYFYERHKRKGTIQRSGRFYKSEHVAVRYDHIIAMGEIEQFGQQYENPFSICPTGFLNSDFIFKSKDHLKTRRHFLWLGSSAVIHKGLDLLVDIAGKRTDITLHICGLDEVSRDLLALPARSNIIDYGFVNVNSETFLRIAEACSFSILPSCSEGMATSITTSMLHGLIPVVMKDAGFNRLGENAIFLEDYRIDYLDRMLSVLVESDPSELESLSEKVHAFAIKTFTPAVFEENLRFILNEIFRKQGGN